MDMKEPLGPSAAKRLILGAIAEGTIVFTKHALKEMQDDDLSSVDVVNVLRGGVVDPGEHENGSWRYRVRTSRIVVVVAFRLEKVNEVVVVTAWRPGV